MDRKKIIEICLDLEYGSDSQNLIRRYIYESLNNGEYHDGFEVVVYNRNLDFEEFNLLVNEFKNAYREDILDIEEFSKLVDLHLPQSAFSSPVWLVSESGHVYISDGLRVAKINNNEIDWVTKRISYDGITLEQLTPEYLIGTWHDATDNRKPWKPIKIRLIDGCLVVGEIIDF